MMIKSLGGLFLLQTNGAKTKTAPFVGLLSWDVRGLKVVNKLVNKLVNMLIKVVFKGN